MFRRLVLGSLILVLLGGPAAYAQLTQSSKVIKAKPPKKIKAAKIKKPPRPPKPASTKLTPDEKVLKKANDKAIHEQRKAFVNQNKEQTKQLKAQQKALHQTVKQAQKQAKNNK
jgi:hypothetical protein